MRDLVENKKIDVKYINTKDQIADVLTKGLPKDQFQKLCRKLGMEREI